MREIAYKCDRCNRSHISVNQIIKINICTGAYHYDLLDMDLCPECTDKLTAFLGVDLIEPSWQKGGDGNE